MPTGFIAFLSLILYGVIGWLLWKKRAFFRFSWPSHPTFSRLWLVWVVFLVLLAPLSYYEGDMDVWQEAIEHLLEGKLFPDTYVYLPVYAEVLAALVFPFQFLGADLSLVSVYVVKGVVILGYIYSAMLMASFVPKHSELAPLGIVLAPATVFYIFFGTNHLLMFFFLLLALTLLKEEQWFWAGFFAGFSCYKFLMVPTILVLTVILLMKADWKKVLLFASGGVVFFLPSLVYYLCDPQVLIKILENRAAIGAHSYHIEPFHFLFPLSGMIEGFEAWYIGGKVWFYLSLLGVPVSLGLYYLKRVNTFQALALSYAFVALFAPEPFRLEPLIGLLWMDAVFREDLKVQSAVFVTLFVHAAAWYDKANSRFLDFDSAAPMDLWAARGLYLGLAVIIMVGLALWARDKRDLMFEA